MVSFATYRQQWLGNIRTDLLAGLIAAPVLIPEAVASSIIAGVDPKIGLYASFSIAVIGDGRHCRADDHAVRDHGQGYLMAATRLAGLDRRRTAEAGLRHTICLEVGDDRHRERAGDPDLHGATARA